MLTDLQVIVQPVTEPIDIDDIKRHLHIIGSAEDSYLLMLMGQCREELEHVLRKSLPVQTLQATYTLPELTQTTIAGFIGDARNYYIELMHPPIQTVQTVEIEYVPGMFRALNYSVDPLVNTNDYFIQPGSPPKIWLYATAFNDVLYPLEPNYIAIEGFPSIRATYTAGYTDVPKSLTALLLQLIAFRFYNREDPTFPSQLLAGAQGRRVWRLG